MCLALLAEHKEGSVEAGDHEELVHFEAHRRLCRLSRLGRLGRLFQRLLLVLVLVMALPLAMLVLISRRPIGPCAELGAQFLWGQ